MRPEKGGLMLGGYEPEPVQFDMRDLPADFHIDNLALDLSVLRRLAESVAPQFPIFATWLCRSTVAACRR